MKRFEIPYHQPARKRGMTKNNFYSLYDMAMLGITNLSKVPLRLVTFPDLRARCFDSGVVGVSDLQTNLLEPLLGWHRTTGDWRIFLHVGADAVYGHCWRIHRYHSTLVQKRPLVVEQERINFEYGMGEPLRDGEGRASTTGMSALTDDAGGGL